MTQAHVHTLIAPPITCCCQPHLGDRSTAIVINHYLCKVPKACISPDERTPIGRHMLVHTRSWTDTRFWTDGRRCVSLGLLHLCGPRDRPDPLQVRKCELCLPFLQPAQDAMWGSGASRRSIVKQSCKFFLRIRPFTLDGKVPEIARMSSIGLGTA